jgi:hypothetical protein
MIFVDYLGPATRFADARDVVAREVASALRVPSTQVVVRRIVTEDTASYLEVWVELSSEEQLYRVGRRIAQRVAEELEDGTGTNVWVMFRVVPRSYAFLNGEPRGRGTPGYE